MKQHISNLFMTTLLALVCSGSLIAQGPPITADKPIMLGGGAVILKTLTEFRNTEEASFMKAPLMLHYLPSSNSLVAVHLPFVSSSYKDDSSRDNSGLGDIGILTKYQFYRQDGKGKTFRMVAKAYQTLPTGENLGPPEISAGVFQSYLGVVAGYESLKYGISWELGYNLVPDGAFDEFRARFGVGLPLLKPVYPVKQINLYFEYAYNSRAAVDEEELLFAQGVQYAIGRLTFEAAVQLPIYQRVNRFGLRNDILIGTRYIF